MNWDQRGAGRSYRRSLRAEDLTIDRFVADAEELVLALRRRPAPLRAGRLASLAGVHLAFTGILSRTREEAARAARRAGAVVHHGPSVRTSVVVRGRPNPQQAAGREAGIKLMEIKRLREKGHRITLLNEAQFWRLAGRRAASR